MPDTVLSIRDLRVYFNIRAGTVRAVDGVDLDIAEGEKLGLVGESGSGKTTTALAIMRMIKPPGEIAGGTIQLDGRDLVGLSEPEMRAVRGNDVAMVPQAAMNALNPVRRIRSQMIDGLRDHGVNESRERTEERLTTLVAQVGLNSNVLNLFPHELSGGMKQRVTIAMAICHKPRLILADEPTSALDVVVQRQVMETLEEVRSEIGAAVILVGHDMGLMAQFADRIGVMYAGKLVELATVEQIFSNPRHPYTRLLISSLPDTAGKRRLEGIPGLPPSLLEIPPGCPFMPRCPEAMDVCGVDVPELLGEVDMVSCHLHTEAATV
ncbi:MAG: ABC transporter ATP-binding protein [Chloroflexi bacterium]|nr:ABC transporter ATP-binding protein [Chloroflexota bacterium]